jgi:hypothetical protein
MLEQHTVDDIRRLLAEGALSMRKIATSLGVSRGTVNAIAHGNRVDRIEPVTEDDMLLEPRGPLRRCPKCGGIVQMPCRMCRVREWIAGQRRDRRGAIPPPILGLDLRPEHDARYRRVRARKLRALARGETLDDDAAVEPCSAASTVVEQPRLLAV